MLASGALVLARAVAVVVADVKVDKVVLAEEPFSEAVMATISLDVMAPEAIPINALLLPAAMLTEAGAVTPLPAGVTVTAAVAPPVGAAAEREITQVALDAEPIEETGQLSDDTLTSGAVSNEIAVLPDDPLREAVSVAVEFAVIAPVLTLKEALAAPCGTVTDAGAVSAVELEASATVAPPAPAVALRKTRQFVVMDGDNELLLHPTAVTFIPVVVEAISEMEVEADDPLREAVSFAVEFAVIAPVLTLKEALAAPCGTVTDAGAVSAAELEASATVAPPAPAVALRLTRQFVVMNADNELLLHPTAVTFIPVVVEAISEMEVEADDPLREAVSFAMELAVIAPVLTLKEALAAPCGTVTDAGAVSVAELEASATVAPPVPAVPLRVTEQEVKPEAASEALAHNMLVTVSGAAAAA